ncbi:putative pentatricopeptide repeat-containing protein At3g13770, mitochondrial [Cryptomeria japonica]|uniref:putative pentatricopeptide repeat-containing protein At3g13770, mitochondrial n=1 Tax=Cryptomeria japonica TaxID=3369 RepID=UPI0027DA30F8|nr:putative pentatricopeptide repeat-containing protein At3g13770, mitochondrial [Cryptomeria japonica]
MNRRGFMSETFLFNTLITIYGKCGSLLDAHEVFDEMPELNVISWTAMISACASSEEAETALGLFSQMQRTSIQPNHFTLSAILSAIRRGLQVASLEQGLEVHAQAVRRGLQLDLFVGNALVDMYVKCGSMEDALHVFDTMPQQDVVSWTSIIAGCEQNGLIEEALEMFHQMQQVGVMPNLKTFTNALSACPSLSALEQGVEITYSVK